MWSDVRFHQLASRFSPVCILPSTFQFHSRTKRLFQVVGSVLISLSLVSFSFPMRFFFKLITF